MEPRTERKRAADVKVGDRIAYRWVTGGIDRWLEVTSTLAIGPYGPGHGWHIMCIGYPYVVCDADAMVEVAS